jgi:hypothetical protein
VVLVERRDAEPGGAPARWAAGISSTALPTLSSRATTVPASTVASSAAPAATPAAASSAVGIRRAILIAASRRGAARAGGACARLHAATRARPRPIKLLRVWLSLAYARRQTPERPPRGRPPWLDRGRHGFGPFLPVAAEVSAGTQKLLDTEVRRIVAEAHDEVVTLLTENRARLDARKSE